MGRSPQTIRDVRFNPANSSSGTIEIYVASAKFRKEERESKKREQEAARESD